MEKNKSARDIKKNVREKECQGQPIKKEKIVKKIRKRRERKELRRKLSR